MQLYFDLLTSPSVPDKQKSDISFMLLFAVWSQFENKKFFNGKNDLLALQKDEWQKIKQCIQS